MLAFFGGRRLATRRARAAGVKAHSRPTQHGLYAMIWVGLPALVILILAGVFSGPITYQTMAAGAPISSSTRRTYFTALAGRSFQDVAPAVLSLQPSISS